MGKDKEERGSINEYNVEEKKMHTCNVEKHAGEQKGNAVEGEKVEKIGVKIGEVKEKRLKKVTIQKKVEGKEKDEEDEEKVQMEWMIKEKHVNFKNGEEEVGFVEPKKVKMRRRERRRRKDNSEKEEEEEEEGVLEREREDQ